MPRLKFLRRLLWLKHTFTDGWVGGWCGWEEKVEVEVDAELEKKFSQ